METRRCKCGNPSAYGPKQGYKCRECHNEVTKKWNRANRDKCKDMALIRKFGITLKQYHEMSEAQGGVCAICRKANSDGRLFAVDHDHKTQEVRGLLCGNCNRGIGNLHDSIEVLQAAISYLMQYSGLKKAA